MHTSTTTSGQLRREVGLLGAVMIGLGSILGTGVFVSIGLAAGVAGSSVLIAIVIAAVVATCNGLSSAQLAAVYPVSGGTYEYGYQTLSPSLGFTAGWMFLCAKTASAATAALGIAGYLSHLLVVEITHLNVLIACSAVVLLTILVLSGMRRSSAVNIGIVSITLAALIAFVTFCLPPSLDRGKLALAEVTAGVGSPDSLANLFHAAALAFVAFTGYGRIATLGEEVRDPRRIIPAAVIITLIVSAVLYIAVATTAIAAVGSERYAAMSTGEAAPLELIARQLTGNWLGILIGVGAVTAMLGVLLNLILGLSRVVLAMGRRNDLPPIVSRITGSTATPGIAVAVVSVSMLVIIIIGDITTAWTFSAFTVLIYYGITNLAALRLTREQRRYPKWIAASGVIGCLGLAVFVPWIMWIIGGGLLAAGLALRVVVQRMHRPRPST